MSFYIVFTFCYSKGHKNVSDSDPLFFHSSTPPLLGALQGMVHHASIIPCLLAPTSRNEIHWMLVLVRKWLGWGFWRLPVLKQALGMHYKCPSATSASARQRRSTIPKSACGTENAWKLYWRNRRKCSKIAPGTAAEKECVGVGSISGISCS